MIVADKKPKRNLYADVPKYIEIETTILCNAKCWFCPQSNTLRQPNFMEDWVWRKIVDETRGIGAIYRPFLLNEPFFDRRMPLISAYIKQDPTAGLEFNSNGSVLTPAVADRIIETGVDAVRFSVDGYYRETFDESRGLSYDQVYANVKYFLKAARESGKEIVTEVRMIRFPGTEAEQVEFQQFWEQHGPTRVVFTELYAYPWEGQTAAVNLPCPKIENELFFYVDGTATLCCWDSVGRAIVGDVKTQHALEIWNGEKMKGCRTLLDAGQRDQIKLCSRCDAFQDWDFSEWGGDFADSAAAAAAGK